ncbi:MAG TPA: trypsin-like peptidase domain-containing protein [Candidatus Dormibacteraeota bacterium]|nr:trypsin-like peptidase domain-containing protein [Candidatus Dormibacteraeota bacterium]
MSETNPTEPHPNPPEHSLLPPPQGYPAMPPPPPWGPPPAPSQGSFWSRVAAFLVLIAVVAAAAGAGIGWSLARAINAPTAQSTAQPESPIQAITPGSSSSGNLSQSAIVAKVAPAIVDINTVVGTSRAAGTGMLISSTGEILTNNHVIAQSSSIKVTVHGRSESYTAHLVGADVAKDVAVIQLDQSVSGLPTVKFASSAGVKVGDQVVAIGNALGRGGTPPATAGQVTALDQTITASEGGGQAETLDGLIQSDATIYEGDSGGALVNSKGQVIGMITAGQAQGFRSSGSDVGYAIASDTALGIVNRIRAHEQASDLTYSQTGFLGVQVQSLDASTAAQLGLNVDSGALVIAVVSGSPAEQAGLNRNAVITQLGGMSVTSADTLGSAIHAHKTGDQVAVTWVDSSGSHSANITLAGVNP